MDRVFWLKLISVLAVLAIIALILGLVFGLTNAGGGSGSGGLSYRSRGK